MAATLWISGIKDAGNENWWNTADVVPVRKCKPARGRKD